MTGPTPNPPSRVGLGVDKACHENDLCKAQPGNGDFNSVAEGFAPVHKLGFRSLLEVSLPRPPEKLSLMKHRYLAPAWRGSKRTI